MAKAAKQPAIIETESLSAAEEKQMSDMRASEREVPEPEAPAPEPKQETEEPVQENKPDTRPKMVPHEAMEAERQKRKAVEKQLEEDKIERARLEERVKMINEAMAPKEPAKPQKVEIPDPATDALGTLNALKQNYQLNAEETRLLQQNYQALQQQTMIQNQIQDVINKGTQAANEYKKTVPDFDDAFNHLHAMRLQELKHMGMNEQAAKNQVEQDKLIITTQALNSGQNPAEIFYNIAKTRGYAAKAAQTQISEAERVNMIQQGQNANRSLSDIQGGAPNPGNFINSKDLATMSEAQFAKVLANMGGDPEAMKKVFGG